MPVVYNNIENDFQIGIWHITESSNTLFNNASLSDFEIDLLNKIKNENRKKQWLATRCLLNEIYNNETEILYNENGKPKLEDGTHVSISHTQTYAAIIISKRYNVAIDIETVSNRILKVKHKFVKPTESSYFNQSKEIENCTLIWCIKESLCKLFDFKIFDFINNLTVLPFEFSEKGEVKARAIYMSNVHEIPINYFTFEDSLVAWCYNKNEHL